MENKYNIIRWKVVLIIEKFEVYKKKKLLILSVIRLGNFIYSQLFIWLRLQTHFFFFESCENKINRVVLL